MKLVLHNVRDIKLPKGGVLTLFTGDQKPLKPPDGSLAWLSQNMLTNFYFHYSIHYVRAVPGSEKLSKLDETNISEIEAPSIASMITSNCIIKKKLGRRKRQFCYESIHHSSCRTKISHASHWNILNDSVQPSYLLLRIYKVQLDYPFSYLLPVKLQNS